jgi:hypothetical protein
MVGMNIQRASRGSSAVGQLERIKGKLSTHTYVERQEPQSGNRDRISDDDEFEDIEDADGLE